MTALAIAGFASGEARAGTAAVHPDLERAVRKLETARGPEAYGALRAVWDTWDRSDPDQVEDVLGRAAVDAKLSPEVQVYASLLSAYGRLRRGDVAASTATIRRLGYVDRWLVVGPFDDDGKAGFDTAYGPETDFGSAIVPGRAYSGKERPVRYRVVPSSFPFGYLDTGSLVRPERKTCVYATSFVTEQAEGVAGKSTKGAKGAGGGNGRDITLYAGAGGALKVFWNGVLVVSDSVERRFDADRFSAKVRLEPGLNDLTVKACNEESAPVIGVRLADANGKADPRIQTGNALESSALAAETVKRVKERAAKASRPPAASGPVAAFEKLVSGPHPRAADLESYARYLVATGGDDPVTHRARNLAEAAADAEPTIPRLLLAAELAEEKNQRARFIERAEALPPKADSADDLLLARAARAREGFGFREAFPLYERVLGHDPDDVTAIRGEVELLNDVGLKRTALALLERSVARNPKSVLLLNMYGSELRALGRDTEASEAEARYAALRFDDRTLLSRNIDLAVARRDKLAAERWIDRLLAVEPDGQWALGAAARAYRALSESERAVGTLVHALDLAPEDVGTLRSLADLQGELGNRGEQLALLGKVLEVEPQNKDVREYVEHLEPKGSRLDESFAWDADRFLKERAAKPEGRTRRTLLDLSVTTVFENGLSSKFRQIVFQPLTDAAAALARQYAFGYQADEERVQLRGARVFRGDGTVDEAVESGEGAADDPTIAMYTSARTFYVQFPRLEPGDVVELRYRVDTMSAHNQMADYFGEVSYLQSSDPTSHAEYVLVTPKSRKVLFDAHGIPGLRQATEDRGDQAVHRFFADHLPPLLAEPAMPPWPGVLGFVHASTFQSWKDLGKWYWGLVHEQFDLDDETRKLARKIAAGKKTPLEKVQAVYDWVVTNTRYVALEFGIYGYKPHRCVQTVSRGWGDCKDKATVIVTLLKELGIDSTIVIVRSGLRGDFDSSIASLAPFDHAIAYVPSLDLYLDGTAEYTGSSELPAMDAGSLALRVNEGNSELVHLPYPDPEKNVRRREVVATVKKDGSALLEVSLETAGTAAAGWRRRFHAESTRRDRVTEELGGEFAGFSLSPGAASLVASDLEDLEKPVSFKLHGAATRFARPEGDSLSIPVTPSFRLTPTYASLTSRHLPLRIPPMGTIDDTFVVKLPPGTKVLSLPPAAQGTGPFGSYAVSVTEEPQKISVKTKVTLTANVVPPDAYAAWKQFAADVDSALTPRLVVGAP
ncbi:MAG TPA: DUF3857 domain-containing protein [Polyangiaceae bacterium]|nr:DUF3857 domain-containing protein [Polyangiaceae bacterium]